MKNAWVGISCAVAQVTACAGVPQVASSPVRAEYRTMVGVDSAAVETILSAIIDEQKKYGGAYELTVDVDADSRSSSFRSVADERRGSSPTQRYAIADSALLQTVADSRRRLLTRRGVSHEPLRRFPGCASHLSYDSPPDSTGRPECPKVGQLSVAIQLPHRGEYPEVRRLQEWRSQRGNQPIPTYDGQIWSVPVGVTGVGSAGGSWSLTVYVLSRDPQSGAFKIVDTILYGAAD
jgi:hypothetical protein